MPVGDRPFGRSADDVLVKALAITAELFRDQSGVCQGDANVYTLKRHSGTPEERLCPGRGPSAGLETYALYGSFQYGILASVATVALQTNVRHDVRD